MAYFLAPSLVRLRSEVNALWPGRSKVSDGWIGDTAHSARKSDHNPDYSAGGIVRAIDVTNDGINVDAFVSSVIRDARTRYVITRGRIWTRENGWQKYTGANAHNHHVHVSVRTGGGYDMQIHSWGLSNTVGNNLGGGGSVAVPNLPGVPAPITPEDFMSALSNAEQRELLDAIRQTRDYLGARGGSNTETKDSVGYKVNDIQKALTRDLPAIKQALAGVKADSWDVRLALTSALPALINKPSGEVDVEAVAAALKDTLSENVRRDVANALLKD